MGGDSGQTKSTLERVYVSSVMGKPWDPPGGDEECGWGEGLLKYLAEPDPIVT